jgi:transposase
MLYVFEHHSMKTAKPDEASFTTLKMLLRAYYDLQTERTAHFQKLQAYIDQVYLNFDKDCLSLKTAAAQAFLTRYPLPENVLQSRKSTIENLLKKHARKSDVWVQDKLGKILAKAETMKRLGSHNTVFAQLIRSEIDLYQMLERQMDDLLKNIDSFLLQNVQSDNPKLAQQVALLDSIPGVGKLSAMTIVAEAGDITRFKNARALTAFAGLDPSVKESGKFKGKRNKISKRGSRLLRRALNLVASRSVSKTRKDEYVNPFLHEFYERKCQAKPKLVALTAVAHKLIYIIFAVIRNNQPFYWSDPEQHKANLSAA